MKSLSTKPVQHRVLAFLVLMLLALAILGVMIGRNLHHFNSALAHVSYSHSVQHVSAELQQSLIEYLTESISVAFPEVLTRTESALNKTLQQIETLKAESGLWSPETQKSMDSVRRLLAEDSDLDRVEKNIRLINALKLLSQTLDNEVLRRDQLLTEINSTTETELTMASVTFGAILVVAFLFFHRRILHPLNDLKQLLQRLSEENYTQIATDHLDPLLLPVFHSYNEMVNHLAELEEGKRLYAQSLQREVRMATQALLEQQTSLARAERLAAIGEVTAKLAHEIRNPLAGIQMAINNLRREIDDSDQCERLELINNELIRLSKLSNDILDQSRHSPEVATDIDLTTLIHELVMLTRYQVAESIALEVDSPKSLFMHVPESGMRQALLNLILNAAEALDNHNGIIRVLARIEEQGIRIEVLDNGPGFAREWLDYGIRPFRTSRPRGTGLGLAMVQRYVRDLGGAIKLANRENRGARVTLLLPQNCLSQSS